MKRLKTYLLILLAALAVLAIGIACAYNERGYWAYGGEFLLPIAVAVALLPKKGEKR
ncbi:MAG: hypothetical protein IKY89_05660 [Alistipes sp.]|nr:hypothetical protein [Alistipes sp.]